MADPFFFFILLYFLPSPQCQRPQTTQGYRTPLAALNHNAGRQRHGQEAACSEQVLSTRLLHLPLRGDDPPSTVHRPVLARVPLQMHPPVTRDAPPGVLVPHLQDVCGSGRGR